MKVKQIILIILFFVMMITSLWQNNIYILFLFSILCWIIIPFNKGWDIISVILLLFSIVYSTMEYLNDEIGSGFVWLSHICAPVAFYRFGRWTTTVFTTELNRQKFLLTTLSFYLLPLFILTAEDVALVGIVNEKRVMIDNVVGAHTLAATLYGLMAATGIGGISALFINFKQKWIKLCFIITALLSTFVVIHLVNRTGVIVFIWCIFISFVITSRRNKKRVTHYLFLLIVLAIILGQSEIINSEILDAYAERENNSVNDASQLGGRLAIWVDAIEKLFTCPLGWERVHYCHNLWLDIARVGGWISLIPFVWVSVKILKAVFNLSKDIMNSPFYLLIVSINATMILAAFFEPVIDGSFLFLVMMIMIWGISQSLYSEKKNILHLA